MQRKLKAREMYNEDLQEIETWSFHQMLNIQSWVFFLKTCFTFMQKQITYNSCAEIHYLPQSNQKKHLTFLLF